MPAQFGIYPNANKRRRPQQQDAGPMLPPMPQQAAAPAVPQGTEAPYVPDPTRAAPGQRHSANFLRSVQANNAAAAVTPQAKLKSDIMSAPILGPNYLQNRGLTQDANARANAMNSAQAGYVGSGANLNNAQAQNITGMIPINQALGNAQAGYVGAQANQINTMTPIQAQAGNIQNAQGALATPYVPGMMQNQVRGGQIANQAAAAQAAQAGPMAQAQVQAVGAGVPEMDRLRKENEDMRRQLARFLTNPMPMGGGDPAAAVPGGALPQPQQAAPAQQPQAAAQPQQQQQRPVSATNPQTGETIYWNGSQWVKNG